MPACCMGQNMGAGAPFPERLCGTFEDRMTEAGHAVEGLCGARSGLRRGLCDYIPLLTTLPFGHARRYALCERCAHRVGREQR